MIKIILEQKSEHFGKQPVVAVDDFDELAMLVQALQGEPITIDRLLLRKPGDGAL